MIPMESQKMAAKSSCVCEVLPLRLERIAEALEKNRSVIQALPPEALSFKDAA
jgi:hypothetical protein